MLFSIFFYWNPSSLCLEFGGKGIGNMRKTRIVYLVFL